MSETVARQVLAQREMARRHFLPFVVTFVPNYIPGWLHKVFAAKLEKFYADVQEGKCPKLMVFVPPRHGKSQMISGTFPAWALGKDPTLNIIMSSYAVTLPEKFSRENRTILRDPKYRAIFPETELSKDSTSVNEWYTSKNGGLKCAGVGGGISGFGADIFIIDDPVKDFEDSQSETVRETAKNWYNTVAEARLSPKGGMIIVQCMTGDTPVLMHDGTQKMLVDVRPGDRVVSYDAGTQVTAKVLNWASQGCDSVYQITTTSGRMVKANKRHPFLVQRKGELLWVRLQNLVLGDHMIAFDEVLGSANSVLMKDAASLQNVEGCALTTTISGSGLAGIAHRLVKQILRRVSVQSSSTGTVLRLMNTTSYWMTKAAGVLSAGQNRQRQETPSTGLACSASIIATPPAKCGGYYATAVTSSSVIRRPKSLKQPPSTFVQEAIASIEYVGEEEVFDIQVERTENFIANGLVSHNTRWHDDDLAGSRLNMAAELRRQGATEEEIEDWEVVSFPAIAESEEYIDDEFNIHYEDGPRRVKVRDPDDALHPARYPISMLRRKRANMPAQQWSAIYQQNPVPDSGEFFTNDDFVYYDSLPQFHNYPVLMAWDLAVGKKAVNDYTVGLAGIVIPHRNMNYIYLIDFFRRRVRGKEMVDAMADMYEKYKDNAYSLGLEYGQIYLAVVDALQEEFERRGLTPHVDDGLRPIQDKRVRATPARGWMQHHRIIFPQARNASWVETARAELLRFDAGVHDDIVDALAWLIIMAKKMPVVEKYAPRYIKGEKTMEQQIKDYMRGQRQSDDAGYMSA